jgi:hypothetical protein
MTPATLSARTQRAVPRMPCHVMSCCFMPCRAPPQRGAVRRQQALDHRAVRAGSGRTVASGKDTPNPLKRIWYEVGARWCTAAAARPGPRCAADAVPGGIWAAKPGQLMPWIKSLGEQAEKVTRPLKRPLR